MNSEPSAVGELSSNRAELRLARSGFEVEISSTIARQENSAGDDAYNVDEFNRIGFNSHFGQSSRIDIPFSSAGFEGYSRDETAERQERFRPIVDSILEDLEQSGLKLTRTEDERLNSLVGECDHFRQSDDYIAFPAELDGVQSIRLEAGTIYVMRFSCVGGATLSTLRGVSMLLIVDGTSVPASPTSEDVVAAGYSFSVANRERQFYEADFLTKLYGRTLVTYAPGDGAISAFDLDTREFLLIADETPNGDLLQDVFLTEDGGHLVQANSDGSFFVHRLSDDEVVLSGRVVDDEIAVWTEDFQFDATAEAASLIDLRFPGLDAQYSLDRFDATRRVPGLVQAVLAGDLAVDLAPVPLPPALEAVVSANGSRIAIAAKLDLGRPASVLEVYQDGVLTDSLDLTAPDLIIEEGITAEFDRLRGVQWVAVVARARDGTASQETVADLGPDPRGRGVLDAILIGVDVYDDPRLQDLNYAKADVARMEETLLAPEVGAAPPRILTKAYATPEIILEALGSAVVGMSAEDHLVLFFAGHGLRDPDGAFYFATSATDVDDLPGTALAWRDVAAILAAAPGKVTVLLDACHAGAADSGAFATNDDAVAGLSSIPANVTILSASKGRELSTEAAAVGGGLFTAAIAQVLVTQRADYDTDQNGRIETTELFRGVKNWVRSQPGAAQTPWMTRTRLVGSYALF